jgi:hypothetical protein
MLQGGRLRTAAAPGVEKAPPDLHPVGSAGLAADYELCGWRVVLGAFTFWLSIAASYQVKLRSGFDA